MGDWLDDVLGVVADGWRSEPTRLTPVIDGLLDSDPSRETVPTHRHPKDCRGACWACYELHCASCDVVVPAKGPCCGECGHVWRTRWHLLLSHWRVHWKLVWQDWRDPSFSPILVGQPLTDWPPVRWWHLFGVFRCWRPGLVWVCPCCSHDL